MKLVLIFVSSLAVNLAVAVTSYAETPTPEATGDATEVTSPTETATSGAITPTTTPIVTQTPTAVTSVAFSFAERLAAGDRAPVDPMRMFLALEGMPSIELFIDTAGSATFVDLPPGTYTWRVYWPGGFVSPQASDTLPDILRGLFVVTAQGAVEAPAELPSVWPDGTLETYEDSDRAVLGLPSQQIVLGEKPAGVLTLTTATGGNTIRGGVGRVNVREALGRRPVALPSTGQGTSGQSVLFVLPLLALAGLSACFILRRRRQT